MSTIIEAVLYDGDGLDLDRWESLAAVDDSHGLVGSVATVLVPDSQNGSSTVFLRLKVEN